VNGYHPPFLPTPCNFFQVFFVQKRYSVISVNIKNLRILSHSSSILICANM
jgi:hypothetical protein